MTHARIIFPFKMLRNCQFEEESGRVFSPPLSIRVRKRGFPAKRGRERYEVSWRATFYSLPFFREKPHGET